MYHAFSGTRRAIHRLRPGSAGCGVACTAIQRRRIRQRFAARLGHRPVRLGH
ncbi:hypothetical protein D3C74_278620 [compost metagenome]